jgi:hypothetical protein
LAIALEGVMERVAEVAAAVMTAGALDAAVVVAQFFLAFCVLWIWA